MSLEKRRIYEFGNFSLDTAERRLMRDGVPIPLTPKVFETLQVLIENAGSLVEKDALMRAIWQDRFVEESNLTFNIKMLRKALGDDAGHPRFIETVPRSGYRFIGAIADSRGEADSSFVSANGVGPTVPGAAPPKRNRVVPAVLVLLLIGLVGVGFWFLPARPGPETAAPILWAPTTSEAMGYSGNVAYPRLSPNGKYLAYVNNDMG